MTTTGRILARITPLLVLPFVVAPAVGQDHGSDPSDAPAEHRTTEHEFHANHMGAFVGGSTHSDSDETGFTLGIEYARQFSPRWGATAYLEMINGDLERDVITMVGVIFYPTRRVGLVVAPGVEFVSKDVEHHGTTERETETEPLIRFGAAYGFTLTPQSALGPTLFADVSHKRWTLVYGLSWVTGF